ALEQLEGVRPRVHSSGRTDTGVHAAGQCAHVDVTRDWEPRKLRLALNALLPEDIRILDVRRAASDFHARYDASGKEYRYFIWNGEVMPPHLRRYRTQERKPLDASAMRAAAQALVGRHDFAAFSANPNREIEGTVRHLRMLGVRKTGPEIVIRAQGDGFLYRMVRSLAGYLIRVGRGELGVESATEILRSKQRTARVPTAPPQGLFLWRVHYDGALVEHARRARSKSHSERE
ncbi:MAG: tRNA pseudouridine(38-40) synthase TruA, partial [Kiritimatiellae bacterium]|nr:tRNA pseudouridine(38-40) synthase TruA [Kiritimatiellia bacterium]